MKKLLSLTLTLVLCLSLCACGNSRTEAENKKDEITLTPENCERYLTISARCWPNRTQLSVKNGSYNEVYYKELSAILKVEGVSENFNYNDVSVAVRLFGTCEVFDVGNNRADYVDTPSFEFVMTVDTNIAGDGTSDYYWEKLNNYTRDSYVSYAWEIVSVSGTLTPVG